MRHDIPLTREAGLFKRDYGMRMPLVRISGRIMSREGIRRNEWVAISPKGDGCTIYRKAQGSGNIIGFDDETIMLQYEDMLDLEPTRSKQVLEAIGELRSGEEVQKLYPIDWSLRKLRGPEKAMPYWKHPDDGYRLSVRISVVSLVASSYSWRNTTLPLMLWKCRRRMPFLSYSYMFFLPW